MQQLQIIWAAMVGGVLLYTTVAYGLVIFGALDIDAFEPAVMNIVGAVVMIWMVAALAVRRALLARIPRDLSPEERMPRYQATITVALALIEGGGLLMITFGLITGAAGWILVGGAAAAVLMVLARPTADQA
jgi:hypothetical protein